ncbi:hypothetical protein [Streptomyces sp. NPDC054786]
MPYGSGSCAPVTPATLVAAPDIPPAAGAECRQEPLGALGPAAPY